MTYKSEPANPEPVLLKETELSTNVLTAGIVCVDPLARSSPFGHSREETYEEVWKRGVGPTPDGDCQRIQTVRLNRAHLLVSIGIVLSRLADLAPEILSAIGGRWKISRRI